MLLVNQKNDTPKANTAIAAGVAVVIAGGLDLLGEPSAAWHPVVWYGKLIRFVEQAAPQRPLAQFLYGIAMLMLAAPIAVLPTLGMRALTQQIQERLAQRGYPRLGILSSALLEGVSLKPFFALRMLAEAGGTVRHALEQDDLLAARHALRSLVSRDCSQLTAELVAAAAIESLAENLNDSVVAPLFYYVLFDLSGAAAYRLFNTFDSMVGYHGRYEYLGKMAARLDDVLNLVPARLTALLIIASSPRRLSGLGIWEKTSPSEWRGQGNRPEFLARRGGWGQSLASTTIKYLPRRGAGLSPPAWMGAMVAQKIRSIYGPRAATRARRSEDYQIPPIESNRQAAWRIWRRDARKTESPNAGHPMAAMAGALGIQLEKVNHYVLGDAKQAVTIRHIRQAEQIVWRIGVGVIALTAVLSLLRRSRRWSR